MKNIISQKRKTEIIAILLMMPSIVLLFLFKYVPIFSGTFISFFDIDIVNLPGKFVWFKNYARAFKDNLFYLSMWHNIKFFLYALVMGFWEPIILAVLINEARKSRILFRFMYFIPAIVPSIAMTILWKYFWNPDFGLANYIVKSFGLKEQLWLNDKALVYFCMNFPSMVVFGGMTMVIYLAALQNVPSDLYEAAYLEGAGFFSRMWHVTLPMIRGTVVTMLILNMTQVFNSLDNVLIWTGGGPAGETQTLLVYAYKQATNSLDYSYAITMATLAFILTFIITTIVQRKGDKEVQ